MKMPKFAASSSLAMLAALGMSGVSNNAEAIPMPVAGCPGIGFGPQASFVLDGYFAPDDAQNSSGLHEYGYTVCNLDTTGSESGLAEYIRDWELPFFWDGDSNGPTEGGSFFNTSVTDNDSGIVDIFTPEGWNWSIERIGEPNDFTGWDGVADWQTDGDPWKELFDEQYGSEANNPFNFHDYVLHFWTGECFDAEFETESGLECFADPNIAIPNPGAGDIFNPPFLSGFGFTSIFDPTNGPYQASWTDLIVPTGIRTGDPLVPGQGGTGPTSPQIRRALNNIPGGDAPEPGSLALLGIGGLAAAALRRRKKDPED